MESGGAPKSTRRPLDAPSGTLAVADSGADSGADRRTADRVDVTWSVDCATEDTFLYASIANISAMGIFVRTEEPLPTGTQLTLRFTPEPSAPGAPAHPAAARPSDPTASAGGELLLRGVVQWINPVKPGGENLNPGMGVRFIDLDLPTRELLVEAVRTIAYLRPDALAAVGD